MKSKGIVVKVKDSQCIILKKDGTYIKVPASRVRNAQVGAETEFSTADWRTQLKPFLMVASILIVVLGFGMYRLTATPAAAAYVSLDINPSIELEVDDNTRVIGIDALNPDAEKLISGMQLEGKDLYVSVREIVEKAASTGYIKPNQTNYVLSSVTVEGNHSNVVNYDTLVKNVQETLDNKELDVEFVVLSSDKATRAQAKSQGISAGKMTVYKNSVEAGEKLSLEQVKQNSLTNLVSTYKIKVLPNNKKAMVKLLHVPPHSKRYKKDNKQSGDENSDNNQIQRSTGEALKKPDSKRKYESRKDDDMNEDSGWNGKNPNKNDRSDDKSDEKKDEKSSNRDGTVSPTPSFRGSEAKEESEKGDNRSEPKKETKKQKDAGKDTSKDTSKDK